MILQQSTEDAQTKLTLEPDLHYKCSMLINGQLLFLYMQAEQPALID